MNRVAVGVGFVAVAAGSFFIGQVTKSVQFADGDPVGFRKYQSPQKLTASSTASTTDTNLKQCLIQDNNCSWTISFQTTTDGSTPAPVSCSGTAGCVSLAGNMSSTDSAGTKNVYLATTIVVTP